MNLGQSAQGGCNYADSMRSGAARKSDGENVAGQFTTDGKIDAYDSWYIMANEAQPWRIIANSIDSRHDTFLNKVLKILPH